LTDLETHLNDPKNPVSDMTRYVAFLRGINVSGQKIIKMEYLKEIFLAGGFRNVSTFIQSGNVIFEASEPNQIKLTDFLENHLLKTLGYKVQVIIRPFQELKDMVAKDPFQAFKTVENIKLYVTLLSAKIDKAYELPMISPKNDVEIFAVNKLDFFCISKLQNGSYGFPNLFVEKEFRIPATTRNWNTICKISNL
jgi:uncharacterized protein (DUF1697 family)